MGRNVNRGFTLDVKRARAWLDSNRGATQLVREAPYQWVVTLFQELCFPGNDVRWRKGALRALIYFSWEPRHGNFYLRRAVPFELSLLELSQLDLADHLDAITRGELLYLDAHDDVRSALRELVKNRRLTMRCIGVPAIHRGRLRGLLLLVHTRDARRPRKCKSTLLSVGRSIAAFSVHALRLRKIRTQARPRKR